MEVAAGIMPAYGSGMQYPQFHDNQPQQKFNHATMPAGANNSGPAAYAPEHVLYSNSPAHVSTPPDDSGKTSLPSISNLIGIADGDKTSAQAASESRTATQQDTHVHPQQNVMQYPPGAPQYHPAMTEYQYRPAAPPTPPMRSDSMPDVVQSPSTISSHSSFSGPSGGLGSAMNNVDAAQQRSHIPAGTMPKPPPGHHVVYSTSPYAMPGYMPSPSSVSSGFYSPEMIYPGGIYQQKPLPSNFPPQVMAPPMLPPGVFAQGYTWDPQQYMNAAAQGAFPSVQDRYVCPVCKKAFSRPSSLKIHSHSHTGEKPFKCAHPGCGKAFSVRSNMKRHERGCHPLSGNYSS
ncbi:hypothetical protein K461DRAFT_318337 [Myriangium duriaei CBS 260.36]|uniref:C2H2-type domain-containing protein n=1 Tax=Myriangium duriaei CBS 260.36 TaxID=1168546 RepID=A0A9P4MJS4_9PEZI|nr:hypothetical protein K461DRAFT_318337 [Myriangium duriaei CBS 260.36]